MIPDNAHMVEYARKVYFSGVTGSMYNKQTFGERTGAEVNEFMGKTSSSTELANCYRTYS